VFDLGRPATAIPSAFDGAGTRRAGAVLVLLLLLLGALAGALSDTASGAAQLRGGAASIALSVAATLIGMAIVVFAAIVVWSFLTSPRGSSESATRVRGPFWRGMIVALLIPIIFGIILLLHRHRPARHAALLAGSTHVPAAGPHRSPVHFVPSASFTTIGVVALIAGVAIMWAWLQGRRHGRHWDLGEFIRTRAVPSVGTESPLSLAQSLATVRVPDPEEETDPRKAVVAAYLAMTHVAAEAGAERRAHETPAEFLQRLLSSLGSSGGAARRLTFLFETARYSSKPVQETLRSDAIDALRRVQEELATAAPAGEGPAGSGVAGSGVAGSGVAGSAVARSRLARWGLAGSGLGRAGSPP